MLQNSVRMFALFKSRLSVNMGVTTSIFSDFGPKQLESNGQQGTVVHPFLMVLGFAIPVWGA